MALRVISGTAGGLLLKSPKKHALRPTQDRIRQVIFSSLADRVPDAHVLDLYAGTGSIGIEALSRGAVSALFIEQEAEAVQCIHSNLQHCRLTGEVRSHDVLKFLAEKPMKRYDLIFADPPYLKERGSLENDLPLTRIAEYLAPNGLLIWEHYAERMFGSVEGWSIVRRRNYGETGLIFLELSRKK